MNDLLKYIDLKNGKRIGMHILFWLLSLSFFWLLFSRSCGDKINSAIFIAFLSPISIGTTYVFNYYLIPNFLIPEKYFKFSWYAGIISIVAVWLTSLFGILIWVWRAEFNLGEVSSYSVDVLMLVAALFFVVLMGVSVKLIRFNFQIQSQKNAAEKDKLYLDNQLKINELKLLKDQLNPHFLFNTLNNLYGLTLEKSDNAPDLVMRLSNMLDYMLYRTNESKVPLQQELDMIRNYVLIEQHRFEGKYPITFEVKGKCDQLEIAPLILLPLVENCFKHGIRKAIKKSFVTITLKIDKNSIIFSTLNSLNPTVDSNAGGIGLANLRKRLDAIYKNDYNLVLNSKENNFETQLTLKL